MGNYVVYSGSKKLSGFYPNDLPSVFAFRKNDYTFFETANDARNFLKYVKKEINNPDNLKRYGSYAKKHQSVARNLYVVDETTGKQVSPISVLKIKKPKRKSGWKSESTRHALARKGIKTGRKTKTKKLPIKKILPKQKKYKIQYNIGRAKYVVSDYDGVSTHPDGSEFWGIATFKSKKKMDDYLNELTKKGYWDAD